MRPAPTPQGGRVGDRHEQDHRVGGSAAALPPSWRLDLRVGGVSVHMQVRSPFPANKPTSGGGGGLFNPSAPDMPPLAPRPHRSPICP
eukprot:9601002-Alexandrium_andersonii.AAC.1